MKNIWSGALAIAAAAFVAACGGGGAGGITGTGGGGGGGISGTGVSYGGITEFGSVWVNGIEFSTNGTTIKTDDNPSASQSDLRIGMVVRVDGSFDDKTASTITVDDAIKGVVEAPLANGQLTVMGQRVQIDAATNFDNGVVPTTGDYVHVHGLATSAGTVAAGYIEKKTVRSTPPFEVKGIVSGHNPGGTTFTIGTLTVNYVNATVNDMPGTSWNGLLVEAKGSTCAGNPVCGTLTASQVEPSGLRQSSSSSVKAEVEGYVASLTANGSTPSFVIGGTTVVTTGSTVFEGGLASEIIVGSKVEAEGSLSGSTLTASKVSQRDAVRFEGNVASVNGNTVTLAGLPGIAISTNGLTEFKNVGSTSGLAAPNHLRIRGRPGIGNTATATELELRSAQADNRVELRASVTAISSGTSFTMLGVTVNTGGVSQFRDTSDASISSQAFYAALKVGTIVKARGSLSGNTVTWTEVELEQ